MGLFGLLGGMDINEGVAMFRECEGAYLIDIREKDEYRSGHIPGSINVPLSQIETIGDVVSDRDAPLYVYCLSGIRTKKAVRKMESMGYTNVTNIGGIKGYTGAVE